MSLHWKNVISASDSNGIRVEEKQNEKNPFSFRRCAGVSVRVTNRKNPFRCVSVCVWIGRQQKESFPLSSLTLLSVFRYRYHYHHHRHRHQRIRLSSPSCHPRFSWYRIYCSFHPSPALHRNNFSHLIAPLFRLPIDIVRIFNFPPRAAHWKTIRIQPIHLMNLNWTQSQLNFNRLSLFFSPAKCWDFHNRDFPIHSRWWRWRWGEKGGWAEEKAQERNKASIH